MRASSSRFRRALTSSTVPTTQSPSISARRTTQTSGRSSTSSSRGSPFSRSARSASSTRARVSASNVAKGSRPSSTPKISWARSDRTHRSPVCQVPSRVATMAWRRRSSLRLRASSAERCSSSATKSSAFCRRISSAAARGSAVRRRIRSSSMAAFAGGCPGKLFSSTKRSSAANTRSTMRAAASWAAPIWSTSMRTLRWPTRKRSGPAPRSRASRASSDAAAAKRVWSWVDSPTASAIRRAARRTATTLASSTRDISATTLIDRPLLPRGVGTPSRRRHR